MTSFAALYPVSVLVKPPLGTKSSEAQAALQALLAPPQSFLQAMHQGPRPSVGHFQPRIMGWYSTSITMPFGRFNPSSVRAATDHGWEIVEDRHRLHAGGADPMTMPTPGTDVGVPPLPTSGGRRKPDLADAAGLGVLVALAWGYFR